MEEFGRNVRFYRKQRRLTQTELATRVGVAPAYVSQIESALRMPSLKVARRFAESLEVELPVLLGGSEQGQDADHRSDAEKLEALRGLIRSIEFDQENRPGRLSLETYPGARGLRVVDTADEAVRVYVFVEEEPGGRPSTRWTHPGRERVHCAGGRVRVYHGGELRELRPGETVEFDASEPHAVLGDRDSVAVSTARPGPTEESLRVRRVEEDGAAAPGAALDRAGR